jgi:hypothetical protein
MNNLIAHCGAQYVDAEVIASVGTPRSTESYCPIPHHVFLNQVRNTLVEHGYSIGSEQHALTRDGARYFGLVNLNNRAVDLGEGSSEVTPGDFGWVIGLRNSHDKTFPAGLVVGSRVFVCDNLAFSGEIVVARRHTIYILRDLPRLVTDTVSTLHASWQRQERQFALYKTSELNDPQANDLVVRALEYRVITSHQILDVVREWKSPRHPEFESCGKTAWRLFNGFTQVMKGCSPFTHAKRTRGLHHIMDSYLKFQPQN